MKLIRIERIFTESYAGLSGTFEKYNQDRFDVYFALPLSQAELLSDGADTFFILGAIYAQVLGEDYSQEIPCDYKLQRNIRSLTAQWRQWFGHLKEISIQAPCVDVDRGKVENYGALFSGGIDSMFTAINHEPRIDYLISVLNRKFIKDDIVVGLGRLDELSGYPIASNSSHIKVVSNLMSALPENLDSWAYVSHGASYIAIGHLFPSLLSHVVLSSSYSFGALSRWGSHPLTDPLAGSSKIEASNYGGTYTRVEKTIEISKNDMALSYLSVCGRGRLHGEFVNCSRCQKCIRTMTTLDLAGVDQSKATTFDWSLYDPKSIGDIFLRSLGEAIFCEEIRDYAKHLNRLDVFNACQKSLRRSRPFFAMTHVEIFIRRRFPIVLKHRERLISMRSKVFSFLKLRKALDQ